MDRAALAQQLICVGPCGSVGHSLSLVIVNLPSAFGLRPEVQQQADFEMRRLQVVEQLSIVLRQKQFHGLDLDYDNVVDRQVREILSNHLPFEFDFDRVLLLDPEAQSPGRHRK